MREIILTIDGKPIKLTEGQIKSLDLNEDKNPFERVDFFSLYHYITATGKVSFHYDQETGIDDELYDVANHFNDVDFCTEQAKMEVLNRLLKRYSYENGWKKEFSYNPDILKFKAIYDTDDKRWYSVREYVYRYDPLTVYFTSFDVCKKAIDEIIEPFFKGELEVCKLWEE